MPVSQKRTHGARLDALEAQVATVQAHNLALMEALCRAFGAAGVPVPPVLKDAHRPALSVIRGGAR